MWHFVWDRRRSATEGLGARGRPIFTRCYGVCKHDSQLISLSTESPVCVLHLCVTHNAKTCRKRPCIAIPMPDSCSAQAHNITNFGGGKMFTQGNRWVRKLQENLENAHTLIRQNTTQAIQRQKQVHDRKVSYEKFKIDDKALVYFPIKSVGTTSKFT